MIEMISWSFASRSITLLLLTLLTFEAQAQFYPVQVTTQLLPPYSVYLPDYASPANDKLRLVILQRDLTKPSYQVRLQLSIELNGKTILRTSRNWNPGPINLDPGIPTVIAGVDLQPYLDSRNLDFVGISRQDYERTKALPEGSYQICFTAYDYKRQDVQVSDHACSFYWLAKDEPPLINFPACGTGIALQNPQQIVFSWLPRNTSSPNSVNETEYEFTLYEMRPSGRNPNDVVLTSPPVYRALTTVPQLVYGPAEPMLIPTLTYVWRVRAIDKSGRDQFRNEGYSEVCTFHYGTTDAIQWFPIEDVHAEGETERRAKAWWTAQEEADGYKVHYKKRGSGYKWFSVDADKAEVIFFDLEPDTRYEVRVQSRIGEALGPYSEIAELTTLSQRTYQCGETPDDAPALENPLLFATAGMTIDVQGIEMTIKEVNGPFGEGVYSGKGEVSIPYFGGAVFNVMFDQLYINESRVAVQGRIDFITKGVDAMIEEQLAQQKQREREEQQQKNREQWAGTDFYDKIFYYEEVVIDSVYVDAEGNVIVVDATGASYINKDIPAILVDAPDKAIIIEDKNGDQWVVQKDGKVTSVPAGGLTPNNVVVSEEALSIVKEALRDFHGYYTEARIQTLEQELNERRSLLEAHIDEHNQRVLSSITIEVPEEEPRDAVDEDDSDIVFSDFEESTSEKGIADKQFEELSVAAKEKELEHNRAVILQFLGDPHHIDESDRIVAEQLTIESRPVSEYIEVKKERNASRADLLQAVKQGIAELIDELLKGSSFMDYD